MGGGPQNRASAVSEALNRCSFAMSCVMRPMLCFQADSADLPEAPLVKPETASQRSMKQAIFLLEHQDTLRMQGLTAAGGEVISIPVCQEFQSQRNFKIAEPTLSTHLWHSESQYYSLLFSMPSLTNIVDLEVFVLGC